MTVIDGVEPRVGALRMTRSRDTLVAGVGLGLIVVAAAVLRLVQIGSQPGGLYQDEAAEGLDAWRLLHEPGFHPIFFGDDGGREVAFAYLVAAVFRFTGDSTTALRATAAVLGVLTVAVTPLLLRRFGTVAMLAGTGWAAGSLWLICIDRDGMRNVTVPLVGTLALWGLLGWSRHPGDRRRALAAGALCGLGMWTYQPLKLLPLLVLLWVLWLRRSDRAGFDGLRRHLTATALAFAVVALPMLITALLDPTSYFGRGLAVSAANPDQGGLGALPLHTLRTLGAFGFTGDSNARHNVDGLPMLPPAVAMIAALGAWRAWRQRGGNPGLRLALLGIPVFLVPGLASLEGGSPHQLRLLGLAPFCAVLIGLGAAELVERARSARPRAAVPVAAAFVSASLLGAAAQAGAAYFTRPVADRYAPYSFDLVALGDAALQRPGSVVVISDYDALTVNFVTRGHALTISPPGRPLGKLTPATTVLALSPGDLRSALGPSSTAATAVAWDPHGAPTVWISAAR